MFRKAITQTHAEGNELVALCDVNEKRLALSARKIPDRRAMASPPTRRPSSAG